MKLPLIIFICIAAFSATLAQPEIPVLKQYTTDFTSTLSPAEVNIFNKDLKIFDDTTSNQLVFLMNFSLDGYPLEMYAYETAAKNKIGTKENNNGVLFLVVKNDRKMRIEVGYGLEGALPDALASSILRNEVKPYFREEQYFEGIRSGLDAIKAATFGEYSGSASKKDDDNGGFGFFVYIILFIVMSILSRMKRGRGRGGFIYYGGGFGGRSSGSSGSGGFGGFSGSGGSFGGGGASGSW